MQRVRCVWLWTALLFTGCLEMEQTVTLSATGGGKQTVRMSVRDTTLADLDRTAAAVDGGSSALTKAVFDKALVEKELVAAGMALTTHKAERTAGRRSVEIEASFPAFGALQKSPLAGTRAEWALAVGPKPGTAKLTLYPQGKAAWVEARAKAESMVGKDDPVATAFFAKKQSELTGLDLQVRFQLPGDVLVWTANMEKTGAREVLAHITAAQLQTPADLVRRLAPRFEVIFDATGCTLPLQ